MKSGSGASLLTNLNRQDKAVSLHKKGESKFYQFVKKDLTFYE